MELAKLTSKGQLTVPKDVRMALGLKAGDKVVFVEKDGGYLMLNSAKVNVGCVNINGIITSMAMEGLETTPEMLSYAENRIKSKTTYAGKVEEIISKYNNG